MKTKKLEKGMILSAGLGTRLLPITEKIPKPLVPVLNVPNLFYSVAILKKVGIQDFILNTHHLAEKIEKFLNQGNWGVKFQFSRENLLLGTGGGLKKAESFFEGQPFVLANCDYISNVDLKPHVERHQQNQSLATMLLWENAELQAFYSKVGVDAHNHLCSLPRHSTQVPVRNGIFTGIHILENQVLGLLKEAPSGINEVLYPELMKTKAKQVFGSFLEGSYWFDTGELDSFFETSIKLLEKLEAGDPFVRSVLTEFGGYEEKKPGIWAPKETKLAEGISWIRPVVVGKDVTLGAGVTVGPYTVLGDHVRIGDRSTVNRSIILANTNISSGTKVESGIKFEDFWVGM